MHACRSTLEDPTSDPWAATSGDDASVRFANLGAGRYDVETRASLDGVSWSDPVRVAVDVREAWYRTWWALAIGSIGLFALGAAIYRARLVVERQLGRQRARLARDLHDELGAGLGSIGILAGVAARPDLDNDQRQTLAATIAETAQDLSGGLSDLVWSLGPRPLTIATVAAHMAERAARLVPGPRPRLDVRFPATWPDGELSPLVQRNATLIALEAIRNAVRHAEARTIWIGVQADDRSGEFVLEVGDDGRGLPEEEPLSPESIETGHGRSNMVARAREIHGSVEWQSAADAGTRVQLRFARS